MIKILHLSDIHLGSGLNHGRINPQTGLNTRFEDFVAALTRCIDRALAESANLVLFGGDAFPDATPAPYLQDAFATQFRRLVDAQIPVVMLVGNHDQYSQGQGGASLSIYRTLAVPGVVVGDRLETHCVQTATGPVQIITLPWLTRSALLTRPETEGLSLAEVENRLRDRLRIALEGEFRQLDPKVPTVLLAHAMLDTAMFGAERFLAVGKGFTLPMSLVARDCIDYVALGHVHRHQVLCQSPPVVYPGSIERVDFSEEKEDKGFVWIELEQDAAEFAFEPLPVRSFRTIRVDLSEAEDPQEVLLGAIAQHKIQGAIVRLIYQVWPDQLALIEDAEIHAALSSAHHYSIQPNLASHLARPRLPELTADSGLNPLEVLRTYVKHRGDLGEIEEDLIAAAEALIEKMDWVPDEVKTQRVEEEGGVYEVTQPNQTQLRLL